MYITLNKGTKLYRGSQSQIKFDDISWFALEKETALLYGSNIWEYELIHDLKLINIMSVSFHNDYLDRLNLAFCGEKNNGIDIEKLEHSIPLGLPDYNEQMHYLLTIKKVTSIPYPSNWPWEYENAVSYLNHKHRYSTLSRDYKMATFMSKSYPDCAGYIANNGWPSKLHNGLFNRECCIFLPRQSLIFNMIHKHGGSKKNKCKKGGANEAILKNSEGVVYYWDKFKSNLLDDFKKENGNDYFEKTYNNVCLANLKSITT